MEDVIIIGAGVTGSAVARSLSAYKANITVLEKSEDICEGTSKANSGIVHAGFDAEPGSMKAKFNSRGNQMMKQLSEELDFPFIQNGSMVICNNEKDREKLEKLMIRGEQNGITGLRIIEQDEIRKIEPNIAGNVIMALYAPTGGIVCPFNLTIALAENACKNGVKYHLGTEVRSIKKCDGSYLVETNKGIFESQIIINAAGINADEIHNMVSENKMSITARKGEYCLLDNKAGQLVKSTIFQLPSNMGKGVLVAPTVHGNILVGPTAMDIDDREGTNTTQKGLEEIFVKVSGSTEKIDKRLIITSFSGLRAHLELDDFVIGEVEDARGFIDVAGIESPGLTCAPAIGEYVAEAVANILQLPPNVEFDGRRTGITDISEATPEERADLISKNPLYGNIICRCELVTEGEIMEAIHRPLGATTIDGVKRRTRAGMGRCQSGFCSPKVAEILARELKCDIGEIKKSGAASKLLTGYNKEGLES